MVISSYLQLSGGPELPFRAPTAISSSLSEPQARTAISGASPKPNKARGASFEGPAADERARAGNFGVLGFPKKCFWSSSSFSQLGSKAQERVRARAAISSAKWLRRAPEQELRQQCTEAIPSTEFERRTVVESAQAMIFLEAQPSKEAVELDAF